ncbi:asparagine synthase-related protein [Streptomyces sp. NPDC000594]|uniref:asparagine synthase-related protein n=1 Tax=Streptomyces sp. NPDC000594 TaxID=3154261 RepID=UPI00331759E0
MGGRPPDAGRGTGNRLDGVPGVRIGQRGRIALLAGDRVRVAVTADPGTIGTLREALLDTAGNGRWAELAALAGEAGGGWVLAHRGEELFVCGDLSGAHPVFYAPTGSGVVWSTSIGRLAGEVGAAVDLSMVAAQMAVGPEHWPGRTLYEGIRAVPGGYGLFLAPGRLELVDVRGPQAHLSLAEGAPAFGEALRDAVRARMSMAGGRAGVDISGGLDSSAVAILAAGHGEICAVTYHDPYCSAEDLEYARRVAAYVGVPLQVGEGAADELPFTWSAGQPVTERPAAMSLVMGQQRLYLGPVAGWPVHLSGHGGDVVLDSCSAGFTALVQSGRRREARREVTMWARGRNRSPQQAWRAVVRAADLGHAGSLRETATAIRRSVPGSFPVPAPWWQWCRVAPFTGWLTGEGRDRVAALVEEAASGLVEERADVAAQWDALRMIGADCRDTLPLAASWGIRPAHPYLDDRVARAAFAIDPLQRRSVTTFKPLLAAAIPEIPVWLAGNVEGLVLPAAHRRCAAAGAGARRPDHRQPVCHGRSGGRLPGRGGARRSRRARIARVVQCAAAGDGVSLARRPRGPRGCRAWGGGRVLTPDRGVHWARIPGATAVLSLRTDTWWILDGAMARIWDAAVEGEDLDVLAEELTGPGGDPAATRAAVGAGLDQIRSAGLLTASVRKKPGRRASWWGWRR